MSIKLNMDFPGVNLPKNLPMEAQILALPELTHWWRFGSGQTLTDGGLSALVDVKGGATAVSAAAARRPTPTPAYIGNEGAYVFDGAASPDTDRLTFPLSAAAHFDGAFSLAVIFKATTPATNGYMLSTFQDLNVGTWFELRANGNIRFQHGSGNCNLPMASGAPSLVWGCRSDYYAYMRYNGVTAERTQTNNARGSQSLLAGAASTADNLRAAFGLAQLLRFNVNALLRPDIVRLVERYARDVYGVAL